MKIKLIIRNLIKPKPQVDVRNHIAKPLPANEQAKLKAFGKGLINSPF
jgi:hypothetical protein